jgi:hypothetical protein
VVFSMSSVFSRMVLMSSLRIFPLRPLIWPMKYNYS